MAALLRSVDGGKRGLTTFESLQGSEGVPFVPRDLWGVEVGARGASDISHRSDQGPPVQVRTVAWAETGTGTGVYGGEEVAVGAPDLLDLVKTRVLVDSGTDFQILDTPDLSWGGSEVLQGRTTLRTVRPYTDVDSGSTPSGRFGHSSRSVTAPGPPGVTDVSSTKEWQEGLSGSFARDLASTSPVRSVPDQRGPSPGPPCTWKVGVLVRSCISPALRGRTVAPYGVRGGVHTPSVWGHGPTQVLDLSGPTGPTPTVAGTVKKDTLETVVLDKRVVEKTVGFGVDTLPVWSGLWTSVGDRPDTRSSSPPNVCAGREVGAFGTRTPEGVLTTMGRTTSNLWGRSDRPPGVRSSSTVSGGTGSHDFRCPEDSKFCHTSPKDSPGVRLGGTSEVPLRTHVGPLHLTFPTLRHYPAGPPPPTPGRKVPSGPREDRVY